MKARTRKTRWLLIALLFGLLATAGLTFTRHHGAATLAKASGATTPHAVLPQPHAAPLVSIGGKHALGAPAGARFDDGLAVDTDSNSQGRGLTGHFGAPVNTSSTVAAGWSHDAAGPAGGSSIATQPPSRRPAASGPGNPPQDGADGFAYDSYAPLDCELPAGCGVPSGSAFSRQPSGTSGGMPGVHNSGSPSDNTNPQTGNTVDTGNTGGPPSGYLRVASAPELDPATLGGAVTLLLGSLAVLRSRRNRITR